MPYICSHARILNFVLESGHLFWRCTVTGLQYAVSLWRMHITEFAILYSIGNLVALSATGFFVGPCRQVRAYICLSICWNFRSYTILAWVGHNFSSKTCPIQFGQVLLLCFCFALQVPYMQHLEWNRLASFWWLFSAFVKCVHWCITRVPTFHLAGAFWVAAFSLQSLLFNG